MFVFLCLKNIQKEKIIKSLNPEEHRVPYYIGIQKIYNIILKINWKRRW